jgi:DNA replication protein DnaC
VISTFPYDYKRTPAILDRLLHRAVVINIKGPSWRMREHQALTEAMR